jgi:hypothetical protein
MRTGVEGTCTWQCVGKAISPRWPWPKTGGAVVLDVAERLEIFRVDQVRFARGTARYRTWRELERRLNEWASRFSIGITSQFTVNARAIPRHSDDCRTDCQFCQLQVRYHGYNVGPSARARQSNPSRYGECLRIFRAHTRTGMSSQTVYALRGEIHNLPDTISRHGKNSKEEAIWAA